MLIVDRWLSDKNRIKFTQQAVKTAKSGPNLLNFVFPDGAVVYVANPRYRKQYVRSFVFLVHRKAKKLSLLDASLVVDI